jgi:hypothetical protein
MECMKRENLCMQLLKMKEYLKTENKVRHIDHRVAVLVVHIEGLH